MAQRSKKRLVKRGKTKRGSKRGSKRLVKRGVKRGKTKRGSKRLVKRKKSKSKRGGKRKKSKSKRRKGGKKFRVGDIILEARFYELLREKAQKLARKKQALETPITGKTRDNNVVTFVNPSYVSPELACSLLRAEDPQFFPLYWPKGSEGYDATRHFPHSRAREKDLQLLRNEAIISSIESKLENLLRTFFQETGKGNKEAKAKLKKVFNDFKHIHPNVKSEMIDIAEKIVNAK